MPCVLYTGIQNTIVLKEMISSSMCELKFMNSSRKPIFIMEKSQKIAYAWVIPIESEDYK